MCLNFLDKRLGKYRDTGLLILRVGIGIMFVLHGWPLIMGGPAMWEKLGGAMGNFGIHFAPNFWGFMAVIAEFGGGVCLILGLLTRWACVFLTISMIVAATMHFSKGDGLQVASHAIEAGILFFSLILIGPGEYSLDKKINKN